MLFLLRDKNSKILLCLPLTLLLLIALDSTLGLSLQILRLFFWEVIETLDELFSQESFVLIKAVLLATESSALNVLNFELDGPGRDGGYAYVKIVFHKIIIYLSTAIPRKV